MARVSVDQSALTDSRYEVLARLAGWANRHEALGRMVLVWNECQERGAYILKGATLDALLGCSEAGELLIGSALAKRIGAGRFYVKGTKGRIEWLAKKREAARENGKAGGRPPKPKTNQDRLPAVTPPAPAPAPAPAHQKEESEAPEIVGNGEASTDAAAGRPSPPSRRTGPSIRRRTGNGAGFRSLGLDEAAETATTESVKRRLKIEAQVIDEHPDWTSQQKRDEIARRFNA